MKANPVANLSTSYSIPDLLRWILMTLLVGIFLLVQTLPLEARDLLIVVLAGLVLAASIINFNVAWGTFLLLMPYAYLMASMFDQDKITGFRVFLVTLVVGFLLAPKPMSFWLMLRKNLVFIGLVLFFLANLASALVSERSDAVFRSITFLQPLIVFVLSYYFVRCQRGNWKTLMWIIGVGGIFVLLLGLLEFVTQKSLVELFGLQNVFYDLSQLQYYFTEDRLGFGGRISSVLLQPVYAGLVFGVYLICQTYYIAAYKNRVRYWLILTIPLGLLMIILTGSRGPILALGSAILVFFAFNRKRGFFFTATIIFLGMLALLLINLMPDFSTYIMGSFDPTNQSSSNFFARINLTLALFDIFKGHLIFGYGPGLIQNAALAGTIGFTGLAGLENEYATILADGGLLAGASYLIMVYGIFATALKAYRNKNRELQIAGLMVLALAAYYFTVIISVYAIISVGGFMVMIIAGGLAGLCDIEAQEVKN